MYHPFLRGKQFDLIALREMVSFVKDSNSISPIIEPVKETTVTLEKTIRCLIDSQLNFSLVLNPQVGDLKTERTSIEVIKNVVGDYKNYQPAVIVDRKSDLEYLQKIILKNDFKNVLIICQDIPSEEDEFFNFLSRIEPSFVAIDDSISSKRLLRRLKKIDVPKITLTDSFNVQRRNVDYSSVTEEFFSDEHLFYEDENFVGFSDFLTIGKGYSDSGFLPYAVAIHITYKDDNGEFWIRHFVSDRNEDTTDVAGKFGEALQKLIEFIDERNITTAASNSFRMLFEKGDYPGLGTLKKLSILHHLELVHNYLKK